MKFTRHTSLIAPHVAYVWELRWDLSSHQRRSAKSPRHTTRCNSLTPWLEGSSKHCIAWQVWRKCRLSSSFPYSFGILSQKTLRTTPHGHVACTSGSPLTSSLGSILSKQTPSQGYIRHAQYSRLVTTPSTSSAFARCTIQRRWQARGIAIKN